jgi:hypothetical protein
MNEQGTVLFTRLKGLATVVWDPDENRMLAHFNKRGLLATSNPKVIDTLKAMGYREVTAEDVSAAGLPVPTEDEVPDALATGPGTGYQPPVQGESGVQPGVATAGRPPAGPDASQLFEPAPGAIPPGDAGRRKLVK